MSEESKHEQRDLKIDRIYNNCIPERIIHELRDDMDSMVASQLMSSINTLTLLEMLSQGYDYNEIFEYFIEHEPKFKDEYRDELKQLISDWLAEEGQ